MTRSDPRRLYQARREALKRDANFADMDDRQLAECYWNDFINECFPNWVLDDWKEFDQAKFRKSGHYAVLSQEAAEDIRQALADAAWGG